VKSLEGIAFSSKPQSNGRDRPIPFVTATVTFSGSQTEMQVGSSSVCGLTGQLMVESEPIHITDRYGTYRESQCWLKAEWQEDTLSAGVAVQPHLIMPLPSRDPRIPKAPLTKSNRDSRIVKETLPGLDVSDTCSTSSTLTESSKVLSPGRGSSAIWSNSGEAMPEIIELYIRLRSEDEGNCEHLWQGVAYLVVYGTEEDRGTYTMDLPVRRPAYIDEMDRRGKGSDEPSLKLTSKARVNVKVKVVPPKKRKRAKSIDMSFAESDSSGETDMIYSRSMLEEKLEPLLEKIKQNEKLALQHWRNQKRAMDVNVPNDNCCERRQNEVFCQGLFNWNQMVKALTSAVRRCDDGTGVAAGSAASIGSSIATRDSLNL